MLNFSGQFVDKAEGSVLPYLHFQTGYSRDIDPGQNAGSTFSEAINCQQIVNNG